MKRNISPDPKPQPRRLARLAAFLLAAFCVALAPAAAAAGPAATAQAAFNQLRSQGGENDALYQSLYKCYQTAIKQLDGCAAGSQGYNEARTVLAEIHPFLRAGVGYSTRQRSNNNAYLFACAYIGLTENPAFEGYNIDRDPQFAQYAYFAASTTYNKGGKAQAIPYLKAYLKSGEAKYRKASFSSLAKCYIADGRRDLAAQTYREGIEAYPQDWEMLQGAINNCIDGNDTAGLEPLLAKATALRPNDPSLLNIQGKLQEDAMEFQKALNTYLQLDRAKPGNLSVKKHIALNYYNLGAMNQNRANSGDPNAKKLQRQAGEYFEAAASVLEEVVANDPMARNYVQALATAYSCLGNRAKLDEANRKLAALGIAGVRENAAPQVMAYDAKQSLGGGTPAGGMSQGLTAQSAPQGLQTQPAGQPQAAEDAQEAYSEFAKRFVETNIADWQKKDPYETVAEYQSRVTEATRNVKVQELLKQAEPAYLAKYTKDIRLKNEMKLMPYDAENQAFLIDSKFGELVVPVPREKDEARMFESNWAGMQFKDPEYYINGDRICLASLTFVAPNGKSYSYNADKSLDYTETKVDVSFGGLDDSLFAADSGKQQGVNRRVQNVSVGASKPKESEVDKDIPATKEVNDRTFAVIISNENYSMVAPVPMAIKDGETFAKYCHLTLGIPERNIRLYKDASYGQMLSAMRNIKEIAKAYEGDLNVIFYYAGHGLPDESTKDAFLLPIDGDGVSTEASYALGKLYGELDALGARQTLVFLDACFSGATRDGEMLASARGVALRPKPQKPQGNMVVFSAASDEETAFPYEEKGHGLFTYFLLKKLQESKGNVELGELADYIGKNVRQQSVVVNHKSQTPTVSAAAGLDAKWKKMRVGRQ